MSPAPRGAAKPSVPKATRVPKRPPAHPHADYLIVGAGLAGATAAETLRAEGATGRIVVLGDEDQPPYQRPPLSKSFLSLNQTPRVSTVLAEGAWQALGIELVLGCRVSRLDTAQRTLYTEAGPSWTYGQLLIATGARPLRLALPGVDLPGIHYLRSLADAQALRASALQAKRAVVIGGSFIGLEVAASLRQRGIEVTLVERGDLFGRFNTPALSDFFHRCFTERGAQVLLGDSPASFSGADRVQAVHTVGGQVLPCDMVVIGAGISPETGFLEGSGLLLDEGVVVDRFLQASQTGVFAAGDVANFDDPVLGRRHRVEHWDNAIKQGRLAARNMLGQRLPYDEVSYFFSQVFEHSFNLLGEIEPPFERIDRGSLQAGSFAAFYLRNDVPQALFSLGRPSQETRLVENLIKRRVNLSRLKAKLSDPQFTLQQIPNQTFYILQGGGAYGAFECGAVKALQEAGVRPDVVAGVSIGAFNGAIIAGNPERPAEALQAFWAELATLTPVVPDEALRQSLACQQIATWGVQPFFTPRWLQPVLGAEQWPQNWTSLYDTSPMRALLARYVDFSRLKASPVRLMVSAVDLETSELVVFDSYVDELTPDHILASGSLPPAFPWTTVNGRHYWDGGIVSNSPLERVVERCGSAGKQVYIIDLFPGQRRKLPGNLSEVMARRDEILYSERVRSDVRTREQARDYQRLVDDLMAELPPDAAERLRHQPRYIQLMGDEAPMTITRIVREDSDDAPSSRDYDFSRETVAQLQEAGYRMTLKAIKR